MQQTSRLARLKTSIEKLEKGLAASWQQTTKSPLSSWDEYLKTRNLIEWEDEDKEMRSSLVTELLTYPLTMARHLRRSGPTRLVHVIGARAEATLPVVYWLQSLRELDQEYLILRFYGPDIPKKLDGTEDVLMVHGKTLKRSFASRFYTDITEKPDLQILFNPGLAHPKLKKDWQPTLQAVLLSKKPVLFTSLHGEDAKSDNDYVGMGARGSVRATEPVLNPFASRKEFQDGLTSNTARANMYVWSMGSPSSSK